MQTQHARIVGAIAKGVVRLMLVSSLVLASAVTEASSAVPRVGVLLEAPDGVSARQAGGSWAPVPAKTDLTPATSVRTQAQAANAELLDATRIHIAASSRAVFHASTMLDFEGGTTRVSRVDLREGEISIAIPKDGRPLLVMYSKDVFAAVGPGRSVMRVVPGGIMVMLHEGVGRIGQRGRWTPLREGNYQRVLEAGARESPRQLAPAPVFSNTRCKADGHQTCAIALVSDMPRASVGVKWRPVPGVASYKVAVSRDRMMHEVIAAAELPADATSYSSPPLEPGAWWIGIAGVSQEGVEGARAMRQVRVVKLMAEPGGVFQARANTAILPDGKHLSVEQPDGLVLALQGGADVPLPKMLGVPTDEQRRTYRVHMAGDTLDEALLVIERKSVRAEVEVSPRNPYWPEDPVQLLVRVRDPAGRRSNVEPAKMTVTVNGAQVPVAWSRRGDAMVATIPPRTGQGPWVIRLDVTDGDGTLLGQAGVEVVRKQGQAGGGGRAER